MRSSVKSNADVLCNYEKLLTVGEKFAGHRISIRTPTYTFLSKSFSFGRKDKLFLTIYRTDGVDLFLAWESTPNEWKSSYCGCRICFRRWKDPSYLAQKTSFFVTCFNSWKQQSGETLERKTAILSAWSRNGAYELEENTSNLVDRKLLFFFGNQEITSSVKNTISLTWIDNAVVFGLTLEGRKTSFSE